MNPELSRSPFELITKGSFARLWWAGLLSSTGDWVVLFATITLADRIAGETGIVFALVARVLPGFLFASVGGVLADRVDRKKVMVVGDVGRAVMVIWLAFVSSLLWLFIVSLVMELFTLIWQPAKEASVPNLVGPRELAPANSLSLAAAYGTLPVGAALFFVLQLLPAVDFGGFVSAAPEALAFGVDSITFLASGAIIATLTLPKAVARTSSRIDLVSPFRDLAEGMKFVGTRPEVRAVVLGMATALFGGGALLALGPSFAKEILGADESGFAALILALGLGGSAGIVAAGVIGGRSDNTLIIFGTSVAFTGGGLLAASGVETVIGAAGWVFVVGIGSGAAYVMGFTHLHGSVEDEFRGRTFAAFIALVRAGLLASLAVAGATATVLDDRFRSPFDNGVRNALALGGFIVLISGLVTLWGMREEIVGSWRQRSSGPDESALPANPDDAVEGESE